MIPNNTNERDTGRAVTKRRGPVEALAKELYEAGLTAVDNGFIAWDDIPAPMKFCWMAVAEHVEKKFDRRVPAPHIDKAALARSA